MRSRLASALLAAAGILPLVTTGCSDNRQYAQAICVLVDVSGTYADQKTDVVDLIKRSILPAMIPGDSVFLIRIDGESYEKDNVEASMTLDTRPSHANAQKLEFARSLDAFAARQDEASFTDIHGALMLAADYLKETEAGTQTIVAFSDLKEDLPHGVRRQLDADEFAGIRIVAVNVKKLQQDNADPQDYRTRLATWERRTRESGARDWRVILDGSKLGEYVEGRL
jgi:hypothetical protein